MSKAASLTLTLLIATHAGAFALLEYVWAHGTTVGAGFWSFTILGWAGAILTAHRLSQGQTPFNARTTDMIVAALFGVWLLILWEIVIYGFGVPQVLLPPPSLIAASIAKSGDILLADFRQTFLQAVLIGWAMGCLSGFLLAMVATRSPFMKRGLVPIGNFVSALPIVGIAPIMVMWFGFDWPSKAAVVVVMTFFPMFVNTIAGLDSAGHMERDLMRTYGASGGQTFAKLLLPNAGPYIFNALKVNTTLALIGAIVAEFFGTPIVGMGFRMSQAMGRLQLELVWAEIVVAAIAGTAFYGLIAEIERAVTHWHPSQRNR